MTQPQAQQLIVCQGCGSIRANGPWLYQGRPKTALVSIVQDQLRPCPVCELATAFLEMREHVMAIEKEMQPQVEEAAG